MGNVITELYAYVVLDDGDGNEGVPAVEMPDGKIMPLMGADMPRVQSIRQLAQQAANLANAPIRLMRSTGLEVIETIEPEAQL